MALYPSPASSPAHCDSPTNINESNFFINGPPSPLDEGIGVDFQRQENTRKRKVGSLDAQVGIILLLVTV